ncbi:nickel-dependent hydrogenase large subunit [Rhodovulum sp. DZ06]|uniref:nickel-dependent hydrogenase large subunit n=1 Tax=Rhodovulum sp. DZ06 TaxID=3425126 RepID=UPI003D33A2DD
MTEQPTRIIAGPFNRVEGDLEIHLDVRDGAVARAEVNSPLFRGFEPMMLGKPPQDALTIVPRICGICSISQSVAAAAALREAMGATPAPMGARAAALIHGAENLADHITHFHLFFMPDFARPAYEGRPFHARALDRFGAGRTGAPGGRGAAAALEARARLLHVMGILAGKWPHTLSIQPGGVTRAPSSRDRIQLLGAIRGARAWAERELFGGPLEAFAALETPEALDAWAGAPGGGDARLFLEAAEDAGLAALGRGPDLFLSFGAHDGPDGPIFAPGLFDRGRLRPRKAAEIADSITEDPSHAWLLGRAAAHPWDGDTRPDPEMPAPAYSWCKAPRIAGRAAETGALARQAVDGHPLAMALAAGGADARGRVVGRLLEIARLIPALETLCAALDPAERFMAEPPAMPRSARGQGLTEAARGALGHWLRVEDGRVAGYQIIAPTTWNFSPRDALGAPGPLEAALEGAPVRDGEREPLAVQHIVRSFDPCMVCTVH